MDVPLIGFIFAAVCLGDQYLIPRNAKIARTVYFAFLALFSLLTFRQNFVWRNEEALFTHTIHYAPGAARIWNNLGQVYARKGNYRQARVCFKKALDLMPGLSEAEHNDGQMEEAIARQERGEVVIPK